MKHLVSAYGLPVLAALALAAASVAGVRMMTPASPGARTLLTVEPSAVARSEAAEGETVTAEFTLRNVADEPVRILGAPTSCGCTVVDSPFPLELAPGGTATILISTVVGTPGDDGTFTQRADLLVNRAGVVPALVTEVTVRPSSQGVSP